MSADSHPLETNVQPAASQPLLVGDFAPRVQDAGGNDLMRALAIIADDEVRNARDQGKVGQDIARIAFSRDDDEVEVVICTLVRVKR